MKIIVFNGSPSAGQSNTNVIVEAFLEGARLGGAETQNIFLIEKNIEHCKGCFYCWFKMPGKCVFNDDMEQLLNKYKDSDIVCFATPVYTWNMTAAMKNFVDRLVSLKSPILMQQNGNFNLEDSIPKTQQFIVISNSGFPGDNNFNTMKEIFKYCNPILEIYRNCGKLLKNKDEKIKIIVNDYLKYVKQSGYEIVTKNKISYDTRVNLEKDLVSLDEYIKLLGM
ncbi:flavodoxin family protein [Tepidibacter aestuarii]|uniref:flavodoxin family protein n=1 Tax=Tepidibacter aestuarii TaxID=2925782 RepID=UPI0020BEF5E6|nr:flavodoxin family protein [Tepidibacter aestuarii]CAH2213448.1 Flavodoxin family protein [Tepidibacter aestuarii]